MKQLVFGIEIEISRDGDCWRALVGEDLQRGFAGFGDTPFKALSALGVEMGKAKYVDVCDYLKEKI